jgi:hypothetical protein
MHKSIDCRIKPGNDEIDRDRREEAPAQLPQPLLHPQPTPQPQPPAPSKRLWPRAGAAAFSAS